MSRPSTVSREQMIQAALDILIRDGYSAVTIKAVAAELGYSSTTPITYEFGGMGGLREALAQAASDYVLQKYRYSTSDTSFAVGSWWGIDLAIDEPNLYRYLCLGEGGMPDALLGLPDARAVERIQNNLAALTGISPEKAREFVTTMLFYTQGLSNQVVFGRWEDDRQAIHLYVQHIGRVFLRGLGVSEEGIKRLFQASMKSMLNSG